MTKVCPICGAEFEPDHPARKYCSPECSEQGNKDRSKAWHEAHREISRERQRGYNRTYYLKHREELLSNRQEYREKNREKLLTYSREYYRQNKEKLLADQKRCRAEKRDICEMSAVTHTCGFTGLCTDCPYDSCPE